MGRPKAKRGSGQGSIWIQGGNIWVRWRERGRRKTRRFPGCTAEVRKVAERALAVALLNLAAGRAGLEVEGPRRCRHWPSSRRSGSIAASTRTGRGAATRTSGRSTSNRRLAICSRPTSTTPASAG